MADHPPRRRPCSKCGDDFLAKWYGHGYQGYCRKCASDYERERTQGLVLSPERKAKIAEQKRRYYHRHREKIRAKRQAAPRRGKPANYYEKVYGIPDAAVYSMLEDQSGECAICGDRAEHLDHDHESGYVRAWLCQRCNIGLGMFLDSPERLRAALAYLAKHSPTADTFGVLGF